MAFGFTPKFEQALDLNGFDPEQYLVIAIEAAEQLGWNINYTSQSGLTAIIGGGVFSTTEEFILIINENAVSIVSKRLSSGMYDWGKNKKHVEDFLEKWDAVKASLSETDLQEKVTQVMPALRQQEDKFNSAPETTGQKALDFLSIFIPKNKFFITPIIIDINILVFALMVLSGVSFFQPTSENLVSWGANLRGLTLNGQWWRLITNTFLHIGIFHLLFNMYALLYIGLLLEPYLGRIRFAAAYLFTGIIASLTSVAMHPITVSAGASGAIFGMYGVFLALLTTNIIDKKTRSALFASIAVFVVYNLMNGVKEGIDNAAHIGGLVSGLVIGYSYYPSMKKAAPLKAIYLTIALLLVAVVITSFTIYRSIPNDMVRYQADMTEFSKNENEALEIYRMKDAPDSVLLTIINEKGLKDWNANLKILDDAGKLDLPVELKDRMSVLRTYCNLRVKSYNLIYKAIKEQTQQYKTAIDSCNQNIQGIIDSLKK